MTLDNFVLDEETHISDNDTNMMVQNEQDRYTLNEDRYEETHESLITHEELQQPLISQHAMHVEGQNDNDIVEAVGSIDASSSPIHSDEMQSSNADGENNEDGEQMNDGVALPPQSSSDSRPPNDDTMDFSSVSSDVLEDWLAGKGEAVDRLDAFRRGAFCLKSGNLISSVYWLDIALRDADIPEIDEEIEPPFLSPNYQDASEDNHDDGEDENTSTGEQHQIVSDTEGTDSGVALTSDIDDEKMRNEDGVVEAPKVVVKDELMDSAESDHDTPKNVPVDSSSDSIQPEVSESNENECDENSQVDIAMHDQNAVDVEAASAQKEDQQNSLDENSTDDLPNVSALESSLTPSSTEAAPTMPNTTPVLPVVPEPVIRFDPELSKILLFRARVRQLKGEHACAISDFTASLRLAPDSDFTRKCGAYVLRAKSHRESGRSRLALRDYSLAAKLDPSQVTVYIGRSALYMSMMKHALALQDCMKALELDPKNVVAHRRSGLVFAETRRLPQAIRAFNRALALRADYESLTLRGRSFVQLGEFDRALADYSLAISLNRDVALAYGHRSVLYAHLKRLDLAINDASSFINLSPNDECLSAYQNRGVWWAQMGKYTEAINDFSHVISLQPTNSFAHMSRGTAFAQMKRFDESIADWMKVLQLHPNMVKAYYNLGKQYANSGDFEHAAHYFSHVTRLMPTNVAGYQERARALASAGKLTEALEVWQAALIQDKNNPSIFEGQAETLLALDQFDEALVALSGAITLNPADPLNYERRAATFFRQGNYEQGRADIITAKKLRWTIEEEKRSYDAMVETSRVDEKPHMVVVRSARQASAAAITKTTT